jgi:trehalose 6-phosphate phosphatase
VAVSFDDPVQLALRVASMPTPVLIGLDVDGVLAPIVRHAQEARLLDGVTQLLARLADDGGKRHVAVVSGRSLDDLARFSFPPNVMVLGSHGLESSDAPVQLDDVESARLTALSELAEGAVLAAGSGAWIESKPASVAVHIREADPEVGRQALTALVDEVERIEGATSIAGTAVLELFVRAASKGEAMRSLRATCRVTSAVFVGDDVTDEAAFSVLEPDDVRIKVGDATTIAEHRLRDPAAVVAWLDALCAAVA